MDRPDAWRRAGSISGERPFGCVDAIGYCRRVANGRIAGPCRQCAGQPLRHRVFRYPVADIERGLYGFNGTLVGIAVGVFFPLGWQAALLLVAGSVASSPIARIFAPMPYSGFYSPLHPLDMVIAGNSRPAVARAAHIGRDCRHRNRSGVAASPVAAFRAGHVRGAFAADRSALSGRYCRKRTSRGALCPMGSIAPAGYGILRG